MAPDSSAKVDILRKGEADDHGDAGENAGQAQASRRRPTSRATTQRAACPIWVCRLRPRSEVAGAGNKGVVVTAIDPDGPAAEQGVAVRRRHSRRRRQGRCQHQRPASGALAGQDRRQARRVDAGEDRQRPRRSLPCPSIKPDFHILPATVTLWRSRPPRLDHRFSHRRISAPAGWPIIRRRSRDPPSEFDAKLVTLSRLPWQAAGGLSTSLAGL